MVTCRVLTYKEAIVYGDFLKDRSDESKRIYFGLSVSDSYIDQLLERILSDSSKHKIIVAEDEFLNIVGTIHVASMSSTSVEFGVMVAESHRKLGISSQMMDYALTWCRNRGLNDIYMHCLGYNKPIIHLVEKYGLEVTKDHGDADAHVTLPIANLFSLSHEGILRQQHTFQHGMNSFRKMLSV